MGPSGDVSGHCGFCSFVAAPSVLPGVCLPLLAPPLPNCDLTLLQRFPLSPLLGWNLIPNNCSTGQALSTGSLTWLLPTAHRPGLLWEQPSPPCFLSSPEFWAALSHGPMLFGEHLLPGFVPPHPPQHLLIPHVG